MSDYKYYNPTLPVAATASDVTAVQADIPQTTLQTTIDGGYDVRTGHEPWYVDPVSGFRTMISKSVWDGRSWVAPESYDEPYYREPKRIPPILHPLMIRPRRKGAGGIFER